MIIRTAAPEDSPALFRFASEFATSFTPAHAAYAQTLAELLTLPNALLLVAERDGAIAGYLLGFDHPSFFANGRVGWVEEIMVDEAFRRQRVGTKLMEAFEVWAARRNVKLIALATRRAAEFYEALGYEESAAYFRKVLPTNECMQE